MTEKRCDTVVAVRVADRDRIKVLAALEGKMMSDLIADLVARRVERHMQAGVPGRVFGERTNG